MEIVNLAGKKFGRWEVIRRVIHDRDPGHRHWLCVCSCEDTTTKVVKESSLTSGRSVSCGCYRIEMVPRGKNHYEWKKNGLSYSGIHMWLKRTHGKPFPCEGVSCKGKSKTYEWALVKGKKYERKRENFIKLCRSCHHYYDMTQSQKDKISKSSLNYWKTHTRKK